MIRGFLIPYKNSWQTSKARDLPDDLNNEIDGAAFLVSEEEVPLNLSTKPSDVSSSIGSRKSEIWSPGSVCEREARETRAPSSTSPSSTPVITRQIHHSPLTPPSSTERTFQVSVNTSPCLLILIHALCPAVPTPIRQSYPHVRQRTSESQFITVFST